MLQNIRFRLARWMLGKHCNCYQMGYHPLVNYTKLSSDQLEKSRLRKGS